ncbi:hypothetical protein SAMN05892877_10817 [Rhizobium subbaraonis]|uniref:Uncharacterized protein n=1 Tax=Rhizobium subbaraonis TaxID=908946 RepID=A0A285UGN3_9HYPH|nr:hypothetical protein SAMN05892877_10817 [Rhizobium subbaraonis]
MWTRSAAGNHPNELGDRALIHHLRNPAQGAPYLTRPSTTHRLRKIMLGHGKGDVGRYGIYTFTNIDEAEATSFPFSIFQ